MSGNDVNLYQSPQLVDFSDVYAGNSPQSISVMVAGNVTVNIT